MLHNPKELIAFVIVIVVVLGPLAIWGTSVYRRHQRAIAITKERAQFTEAEKDISDLSQKIITTFGQPDDIKTNNLCDNAGSTNELQKGELYCTAATDLAYSIANQQAARGLVRQIYTATAHPDGKFSETDPGIEEAKHPPVNLGGESYVGSSKLGCLTSSYYYTGDSNLKGLGFAGVHLKSSNGLLIELSCSKIPVLKSYYQMGNNYLY